MFSIHLKHLLCLNSQGGRITWSASEKIPEAHLQGFLFSRPVVGSENLHFRKAHRGHQCGTPPPAALF